MYYGVRARVCVRACVHNPVTLCFFTNLDTPFQGLYPPMPLVQLYDPPKFEFDVILHRYL